jgi:hypothetical protein
LPLIHAELSAGRLSYSQVRAVTRMATAAEEPRWLQLARSSTGAQLDKIARGGERARAADTPDSERPVKKPAHWQWDDDGDLVLTLRFPAHEAVPVLAVLEQAQAAVQADRDQALQELITTALPSPGAACASAEADQLALLEPILDRAGEVALHPAEHPPTDPDASAEADAPAAAAFAEAGSAGAAANLAPTFDGSAQADPSADASAEAEAPADASAEASEVPDLLAKAIARGHDPLRPYPYVEPAFPIGPDRLGLPLTDTDRAAITAWETERDRLRAIRNAWNTRCEQLLIEASAQRIPTGKATLADVLVRALTRPSDGPKTTLRLLIDPLSGWARTQHDELLPPATVEGLTQLLPGRTGPLAPFDLCRHDQARSTRQVSPALRRLLGALDGERCRFPGCRHTKYLHAHHLQYWRDGGSTDLANLVLLCTKHHRLLHTAGYCTPPATSSPWTRTAPCTSTAPTAPRCRTTRCCLLLPRKQRVRRRIQGVSPASNRSRVLLRSPLEPHLKSSTHRSEAATGRRFRLCTFGRKSERLRAGYPTRARFPERLGREAVHQTRVRERCQPVPLRP